MKANKELSKKLNNELIEQVESKSNYQANLDHNLGNYGFKKITKLNYQNTVYYSCESMLWFDNLNELQNHIETELYNQ